MVVVTGVATVIAAGATGKVSVKARPVSESFWFGLVSVKVSVDVPPARIGFAESLFARLGGFITVREAVALPVELVFVPPLVDDMNSLTF